MKGLLLILLLISLTSCAENKFKNGVPVYGDNVAKILNIEKNECILQGKEACPDIAFLGCYGWHEKRSKDYDSNKVIIRGKLAEYWRCNLDSLYK